MKQMLTDDDTLDRITSWASEKYTAAAPSLAASAATPAATTPTAGATSGNNGLLAAATTPAPAPAPAAAAAATPTMTTGTATTSASPASSAPKANVSDWYRAALGRDGDAAGISFWQQALDSGRDADSLYSDFLKAAGTNHEAVKTGTTYQQANTYKGPQSSDQSTVVDDWGRNVLGRDLTGAEVATWRQKLDAATTPQQAQQVYNDFVAANGSSVKNNLDFSAASQISTSSPTITSGTGVTTIDPSKLASRTVDANTETVNGQLKGIMAADSPLLQQARADGQRTAFDRGLGNSSIAASAGEDSLLRAALQIATPDAATYGKASDYNTAATNQAIMFNAEQSNQFALADKNIQAQQVQQATQLAQQMTLAQMQDQTTRWQQEQTTANSRYNTDSSYKQQVDNQKLGVANNIIQNMDLSPDRKAAMLEQLGFGTMARPGVPGTGLAGAVYVIDSTSSDLNFAAGAPYSGATGQLGGMMNNVASQVM
jgi:hypothetical protein